MTRIRFTKGLLGAGLGLALVLALAFWLRWQYVQTISLYVDEFTTLWAAKRVLATGAPLMPSGVLYTRGLLASYLTAAVGRIRRAELHDRPAAQRLFRPRHHREHLVGWAPRVEWAGRLAGRPGPGAPARGHHLEQPRPLLRAIAVSGLAYACGLPIVAMRPRVPKLTINNQQLTIDNSELLIVNRKLLIVNDKPSPRLYALFAALFTLALFSQEQTILLYPPILLATLLWRGWRYLRQPPVLIAHLVCLGAMAVRYAIEIVGQPGFFETIQAERPYVGLIFDLPTAWAAYAELFVAPARLPWTLGALLAVGAALVTLARRRWRLLDLDTFHQATLFFALQFVFVLGFILTLVGGQWRDARYLFFVQPCLLLTGAAGAVWLADRFGRPVVRMAVTVALASALRPAALAASPGRACPPGGGL